jgi:hypothetical protein
MMMNVNLEKDRKMEIKETDVKGVVVKDTKLGWFLRLTAESIAESTEQEYLWYKFTSNGFDAVNLYDEQLEQKLEAFYQEQMQ